MRLSRAFLLALALTSSLPAFGQGVPAFRTGGAVTGDNPQPVRSRCWSGTAWIDCPIMGPATSSPLTGTSTGTQTIGPFTPQLGRPVAVTLSGTWAGTVSVMTSDDSGATLNPITIGGQPWATFSGAANEDVDTPHVAGRTYYVRATITSGTLTYAVRQ